MECDCRECQTRDGVWRVKTPAGARSISFRSFPTTREVLKGYFGAFDQVGKSQRTLQLKLKRIAKRTDLT